MKLFQFGNSQLYTTRLGLGLAALGRPGYINLGHGTDFQNSNSVELMGARSHQMLDMAYQSGIRYFDTARSYGYGERFLGQWLVGSNDEMIIGSKWGYTYTADWQIKADYHEIKEHSIEVLQRQWGETQSELGRVPSIYHIHSATLDSGVLDNKEVLDYLWQLKGKSVVIGLSLSGTGQADTLAKALEIRNGGECLFGSVQATYNLLERSVESKLIEASNAGWGVIIKEAVANGRLTNRNVDAEGAVYDLLRELSDYYSAAMDAIAMAWILNKPWVSVVLSGASTPDQLSSNMDSLQINLKVEDVAKLDQAFESAEKYWNDRSELDWN